MSSVLEEFSKYAEALQALGFFLVAVVEAFVIYKLWQNGNEKDAAIVQLLKDESKADKDTLEKLLPILSAVKDRLDRAP